MKKNFVVILLLLGVLCSAYTSVEGVFDRMCTYIGISFNLPKRFTFSDDSDPYVYSPKPNRIIGMYHRKVFLNNRKALIAINLIKNDTTRTGVIKNIEKMFNITYNINNNYKQIIKAQADTINHKVVYFDKKELTRTNSDVAGTYMLDMQRPYLGEYNKCKVIFMHKENRGDINLYYFFNEGVDVDVYIKNTRNMMKFDEK